MGVPRPVHHHSFTASKRRFACSAANPASQEFFDTPSATRFRFVFLLLSVACLRSRTGTTKSKQSLPLLTENDADYLPDRTRAINPIPNTRSSPIDHGGK